MKRIEDIEMMEISDLESASMDEKVKVPDGLGQDIDALLSSLELSEKILVEDPAPSVRRQFRPSVWLRVSGIAAAAAVLIGIGVSLDSRNKALVDTFDDPALAYAQLEKAMMKIGGGLKDGINSVQKGNECIETPIEIINQSLK